MTSPEPHGVSGLFRHEPGAPCVVCGYVSPAGPEEPREGLRLHEWDFHGRTQRAVIGVRTANIAFHYREHDREAVEKIVALANAALATTSSPDTGAEERLRAALDAALDREPRLDEVRQYGMDGGRGSAFNTLQWRLDLIRSALSGGSVDEERDSDES